MNPSINFLGLPQKNVEYASSPVVVCPIPWEKTTSYMKGCVNGPQAILEASHQVEFYDPELRILSWKPGIYTEPPLNLNRLEAPEAFKKVEEKFSKFLADGKFPIGLGGEHSISAPTITAAAKRFPNLSVLQIDAHADLRESYEGTPYSHACAMRLIASKVKKLVGVGIRSVDIEEVEFAKANPHIHLIYDHKRIGNEHWIQEALDHLTDTVYLTIDIDGFDPSLVPATGTPEPGGLSWYEGLSLISALFQSKRVVASDLVELMPQPHQHASNFVAAKLVYKLIGYWQKYQKTVKS